MTIPMDLIEHVISWRGLSDNKYHTMVVFTIKSGLPSVCSCQGVTGNDRGGDLTVRDNAVPNSKKAVLT